MIKEEIIISFTTWSKRIKNLPTVLDSIYHQTLMPDRVVLNLAYGETIPDNVSEYLETHKVEVNYIEDTKVYKKFLPTLKKYPEACVINIDDDCIYPKGMIEEFITLHRKYSNFPISGNTVKMYGMQCHCGCASLTKYDYFGKFLNNIDDNLMASCPSSDMVFTYFATLNGHPYIHTENQYFDNLVSKNLEVQSYTQSMLVPQDGISSTYEYLVLRFGPIPAMIGSYVDDNYLATLINDITINKIQFHEEVCRRTSEAKIRSTHAYRIGKFIIKPIKWGKEVFDKFRKH